MKDKDKTNVQFSNELKQLRQRIAALEALQTDHKQMLPGEPITSPCSLDREEPVAGKCSKRRQLQ